MDQAKVIWAYAVIHLDCANVVLPSLDNAQKNVCIVALTVMQTNDENERYV